MAEGFECARCGNCCRTIAGSAGARKEDLVRWRLEGRVDILQCASIYILKDDGVETQIVFGDEWDGSGDVLGADLWFHPDSREPADRCPFLREDEGARLWECSIEGTKPQTCRDYPQKEKGHKCLRLKSERA